MAEQKKKKSQEDKGDTLVFTFRGDEDKSVGVPVYLAEAPNGGPAYLYYGPASRSWMSKQTKKTGYSKSKFYARNAESHAQALLKAKEFMDQHVNDPYAALEAANLMKATFSIQVNGSNAQLEA